MKNDSELNQLLKTWQDSPPADPHFRHSVWTRISIEDGGRVRQFLRACQDWCMVSLPRPAYALVLLVFFASSGATIATITTQKVHQEQQAEMEQRYVASIDPVAMAGKAANLRP